MVVCQLSYEIPAFAGLALNSVGVIQAYCHSCAGGNLLKCVRCEIPTPRARGVDVSVSAGALSGMTPLWAALLTDVVTEFVHGVDESAEMVRVDRRMDAVAEIENVSRMVAETGDNIPCAGAD
jgi:hypothetical protein